MRRWLGRLLVGILATFFGVGATLGVQSMGRKAERHHVRYRLQVAEPVEKVLEQRPIVVIVPSYNNETYLKKNLVSIAEQDYANYRVIYIDDASTDRTYEGVKAFVETSELKGRFELIHNRENRGALANLYMAIHSCRDEEIVTLLDGDDWFATANVLSDLNHYFADGDVWMTYGDYLTYPEYRKGESCPVSKIEMAKGEFRNKPWIFSHLRSFYAGLFKQIRLEDLMENGQFFPTTYDLAIMLPMVELAREHVFFVPKVHYIYNFANPLNDCKAKLEKQQYYDRLIREKQGYAKAEKWGGAKLANDLCDLIVFSYDRPMQLFAFLESFVQFARGYGEISVIYRASDEEFDAGYDELKKAFPEVRMVRQDHMRATEEFRPMLLELIQKSRGKYLTFAVDDIVCKEAFDFREMEVALEETGAHGFFLRLGEHVNYCYTMQMDQGVPNLIPVGEGVYAWQFSGGQADWNYANNVDMTMYRRSDVLHDLEQVKFTFPNNLEQHWMSLAKMDRVGLCYSHSKILNLPLNVVSTFGNLHMEAFTTKEMLSAFMSGYRMSIKELEGCLNPSAHYEFVPQLVKREADE
ncbi:MAG: hypothetical protein S4CHLAM102_06300 [Chlamydiia bacterium]|nr:hypothetical protein [Chlamydiia bacterium]